METCSNQEATMTQRYTIQAVIYPGDTSGYVAECMNLAIVTQGQTLDETVQNLREAIQLHLAAEDLDELGLSHHALQTRCVCYNTRSRPSRISANFGGTMAILDLSLSPRITKILGVARHLTVDERIVLARLLLDTVIAGEVDDAEDWQAMGLNAFAGEWDNPDDMIYDNWRTLYGIQPG
jgi:predicted RNase H-like HicB family nuclease